jgi:hypothetical protein
MRIGFRSPGEQPDCNDGDDEDGQLQQLGSLVRIDMLHQPGAATNDRDAENRGHQQTAATRQ